MFTIKRLNHAVLYVSDARRSGDFYRNVLGFEVVEAMGDQAVFLRANGSDNHHDLGLFGVGAAGPPPRRGQIGLYHLAWEVESLPDLARAREALLEAGALTGESDHRASWPGAAWPTRPRRAQGTSILPRISGWMAHT